MNKIYQDQITFANSESSMVDKKNESDTNELKQIGINSYLTCDEDELIACFRKLPYKEQMLLLGRIQEKAEATEANVKRESLLNSQKETNDEITATLKTNAS